MTLANDLQKLQEQGLYRERRIREDAQGIEITLNGKKLINFCSNDYLGLANDPRLAEALHQAVNSYGVGSGSAHLICGHSTAHHALEEELADFTGRSRALLFSTGFMANMGVISALLHRQDNILQDRLNHASLLDGALLSRAKLVRYRHNDVFDLSAKLAAETISKSARTLVATDGVFSMDGDIAPLPAMVDAIKPHHAYLMVDDAHGFGVYGETGGGVLQHFKLNEQDVPILMGTLGKSCGVFGAFVAGSETMIETLIQKARTYIYTTAIPAALAEAARASLSIIKEEAWRREKLRYLSAYLSEGLKRLGYATQDTFSAIHKIQIGDNLKTVAMSEALMHQGCWVSAIRPPTVPAGQARLRVTLSANHELEHLDKLLTALARVTDEQRV